MYLNLILNQNKVIIPFSFSLRTIRILTIKLNQKLNLVEIINSETESKKKNPSNQNPNPSETDGLESKNKTALN
jgi:hypothetical protein